MSSVYVLDYDVISSIGIGSQELWTSLETDYLAGKPLSLFQAAGLPATHAAEVPTGRLPPLKAFSDRLQEAATVDRKLHLSLSAGARVQGRFRDVLESIAPSRRGIIFGVGIDITPMEFMSEKIRAQKTENPYFSAIYELNSKNAGSRLNFVANPLDVSTLAIARSMGLGAFQKTILTACSASLQAVAYGSEAIRRGDADFVVVGGSDSLLNLVGYMAFSRLGVVCPIDGPPEKACKPFDVNRGGVLVGEGSGLILLASEEGARRAGKTPLFEMLGWGNSMDAYKITAPDPQGKGMRAAMEAALNSAKEYHPQFSPSQIDYINLHGTGTQANDPAELNAVLGCFGEHAARVPISSTKDRHGHAIGAAGVIELGVLFSCMQHDLVPCTRNLEKPILKEGVNLVQGHNLKQKIKIGMSNSFALGGVNSSIVVKNLRSN